MMTTTTLHDVTTPTSDDSHDIRRFERANCFCGGVETLPRAIFTKDHFSGEPFTYVVCAACGAQRLSPRPCANAIGAYYEGYPLHPSIRSETLASRVKHLIYLVYYAPNNRVGLFRPLLRLLLFPVRGYSVFAFPAVEPRRVFDFGAAVGSDLARFKAEGWDVGGCEPSAQACAVAAERGIILQNCTAEHANITSGCVSCILLNNVLEHTYDPMSVLATCWRGLVPGGSVVIMLPNHASVAASLFRAAWVGYDAPRHLWGFTPASLTALLRRAGFLSPVFYHLPQGLWAWTSSLDGKHSATPVAAWRKRCAPVLSFPLALMGIVTAMCGRGDFMTVVATKPTEAQHARL
jgi:2-polyprenyl-3-methyl-5-hydroxy-6-metoxy-1,4-benzoquinol methylase